jgi:hypothetical protein
MLFALVCVLFAASCSKGPPNIAKPNPLDPQTELTFAPIEFDTTAFRVHFYWNGYDDDGEVLRFHYAVDADTALPINQWRTTTAKDTTLLFLVDPVKELLVHVFKVSAEDNSGRWDKTPASRAFSAKTLPPFSKIEKGPSAFNPTIGPNFTYEWSGIDPDGGETGGKAPVDSFQYLLLRIGTAIDPPSHDPLPTFQETNYTNMIRAAVGDGLPESWTSPNDPLGRPRNLSDWKWVGIHALKNRFKNVTPGEYVFTERAVDIAGATEKDLVFVRNIRHFSVSSHNAGPQLCITSSILNKPLDCATGPDDFARKQLQIFEGETMSFSWTANADAYGGEIAGYTYALDDTSSFPGLDIRLTGATFQPSRLPPGTHFLYVRAVDDGGLVTNAVIPILIVHPEFKEPGYVHSILFVDDSVLLLGNGSGPSDDTETRWWTERNDTGEGPLISLVSRTGSVASLEWDTTEQGANSVEGRKQPPPSILALFTTVVWTTDASNGGSGQTALFKSVAGGDYSELQGYLRAGGTLILTGWNLAQNTSGVANLTFKTNGPSAAQNGICAAYPAGSLQFLQTIFPRMYMGIDNSLQAQEARRTQGFADFVRGIPTPAGVAFGFDTARVDTGNTTTGGTFKWNTNSVPSPFNPDQQLFPGLAGIEGWYLPRNYGCQDIQNFAFENPAAPIVQVVYTYHGVREGVDSLYREGAPSPREGLACGSLVQSHDLGTNSGRYVPTAAIGRIALFTFPLYFLKDADAIDIMKKSYDYVDQSPTLP